MPRICLVTDGATPFNYTRYSLVLVIKCPAVGVRSKKALNPQKNNAPCHPTP